MKVFKLKKGDTTVYPITTRSDFESITGGVRPYVVDGTANERRAFGICPACENPTQIIGLYKRISNRSIAPYAKHYNRDAEIAKHNEYTYKFCPYASHMYKGKEYETKTELNELECNIYHAVRDNFDIAIYIMQQVSGLYLSETNMKALLQNYICNEGHLYYGATVYNIPWMLLYMYTMPARTCYGQIIKKGGFLHTMLQQIPDITYENCTRMPGYCQIKGKNHKFIDYVFSFNQHQRKIIDDEVCESLTLMVCSASHATEENPVGKIKLKNNKLYVNETRFPNTLHSPKIQEVRQAKRSQDLLVLAKEKMPELKAPKK